MKPLIILAMTGLAALAFVAMVLYDTSTVFANTTATLCDSNVKYWCSYVDYSSNGSNWTINSRKYAGGYGYGGASGWKLWLSRDWEYYSGQWNKTWSCEAGSCSSWNYGSGGLGPYQTIGSSRSVNFNTAVQFQHKFEDCSGGPCNQWCSPVQEHYLSDGTSIARDLGGCN